MDKLRKMDLNKINRMLMEMASGNFFYRLERTGNHDNLESIILVLNMLAEEIQEILIHQGYANLNGIVKHLIQLNFLLDMQGVIKGVNKSTCLTLSYLHEDLLKKRFDALLNAKSKKRWTKYLKKIGKKGFYETSMELTFVSKEGLLLPHTCHIGSCEGQHTQDNGIWVTVVLFSKDRKERDELQRQDIISYKEKKTTGSGNELKTTKNRPKLSFEDIRKIREGRNLILNNLEKDLPSLRDFALQLGTNEFKLKYGFKELFGTSVYRFLLQERLRKAKMLIQYTDFTIKTIAYKTGFKSIPHFSRVYKKTYGYAPSELRKISRKDP
ncbi:helix-turn-helix domain-containing protein [Maribacter polysiphoniae]|uniref:helix-turn-helix domain-containing protein n=1 Tax=Maribacter polysiphoniae TaxID=429344 RepID=UPI002351FE52|nr:helix-turn-helix domain-containing protein [Maribacter polysiphoniae]